MKKRIVIVILCFAMALTGCTAAKPEKTQYTATFLTLFDTVTTVIGRAESQEAFSQQAQ